MKEIEIKIRNIDKEEIIRKLEDLGARKIFTGKILDIRFDTPSRSLSKQGKALRIRQKGKYFYLTLKGKKNSFENITSRDEIGVRISNFKVAYRILNELSFIKIFEMEKYRTEYRIEEEINFDIDEYPGMNPILEIEGKNKGNIDEYLNKLGIDRSKVGRVYIREILEAKKNYMKRVKKGKDRET